MQTRTAIIEIIRALLVLLWVYAAISKWLDYYTLVRNLRSVPWFGQFAGFLSVAIPATELIIAVALIGKRFSRHALIGSAILLAIFTGYIIYVLNFAAEIPCSCGGIISGMGWSQHLAFNAAFLSLNIIGILLSKRIKRRSEPRLT